MALSKLSLNQSNNETSTSNKTPYWIDPNPLSTMKLSFSMYKKDLDKAFEAVKKSSLPQEVIEYLIQKNNPVPFVGVMSQAGIFTAPMDFELKGYADAVAYVEYLNFEYVGKFFDVIAPFVKEGSYITVEGHLSDGYFESHRWVFDGDSCELTFPYNIVKRKFNSYGEY